VSPNLENRKGQGGRGGMPERDVGTVLAYSLSKGWTVLMLHLLPEEHKTNCGDRTDGQGGIQRGW